jgi:CheY-like chemotaxis protein
VPTAKLLIVDDFEPFRRFVCTELEQDARFQIIGQASDGLDAVQKAEELQPDLIVLDIGLPKLNGIEAAKRIRKLAPQAKILFLSQDPSSDVAQEALKLGALGYIHKVRAESELVPAIEAVLEGIPQMSRLGRRMHYSFDFDSAHGILRFHLTGRITDKLMRDFYYGMRGPTHRTRPNAGVLDTSTVGSFEVSPHVIQELAMASPIMPNPDFPRVTIAPSPHVYEMMRIFETQGVARRNLHVVRAEREAWAILGVQNPRFESLDIEQSPRVLLLRYSRRSYVIHC